MKGKSYLISETDSKTISILKALMAVMVVFIHAHYDGINMASSNVVFEQPAWFDFTKDILSESIPCCAVPGFFVMAGVLLYKKEFTWAANMKKKLRTLIIPLVIVQTFWIIFYALVQMIPQVRPYFSDPNKTVANWGVLEYMDAYIGFGASNGVHLIYGPLWFVRDLFFLNIIALILKKIIDKIPRIYGVFMIVALVFGWSTHLFFMSMHALVFFSAGYYLVKYDIHFSDIKMINFGILSVVYWGVVILDAVFQEASFAYLINSVNIILGILWWCRVSYELIEVKGTAEKFRNTLSKYNFNIYIFHQIPTTIAQKLMYKILPKTVPSIIAQYFGVILLILVWCVLFSKFLERFMPRFCAVLTGYRKRQI